MRLTFVAACPSVWDVLVDGEYQLVMFTAAGQVWSAPVAAASHTWQLTRWVPGPATVYESTSLLLKNAEFVLPCR